MRHTKRAVAAALLTTVAIAMVGCSAGGSGSDAASCEPADGDVNLTFTSWIPGIEDAVAIWNADNPDIQVEVQTGPSGNAGTYQNFFNQLEAGNAPDLGQIEYDALPNFRVQDGLENLAACEDIVAAEDQFLPWTWSQASLGTDDELYGVPQDQGPMGLFYRSDLFEQNGIAGAHHVGGVQGGRGADPRARRVHHQLLADRHQPVRRLRLAGGRAVVPERRRRVDRRPDERRVDDRSPITGRTSSRTTWSRPTPPGPTSGTTPTTLARSGPGTPPSGAPTRSSAARPTRRATGRSRSPRSGRPAARPRATGAVRRSRSSRAPSTSTRPRSSRCG